MSLRPARAGLGACLIQVMLLHNAVIIFPKQITASHIELANQTTDVIKRILDGTCFIDNQTSCPDVVNISCEWQTPDAPVENAPVCTVWMNCSGNSSHNISCAEPSYENTSSASHPPDHDESGILIGALVGGSVMGVAVLCVLITRHVCLAWTRRTKGRMVFPGHNGRRNSTVRQSGKSETRSRRQGTAKTNSLRDQTVVKEDSQKRSIPKISSDSETDVTSAPDTQDGVVLHSGGNKRGISSTAYEGIADTEIEAGNTDTAALNDKTRETGCLKVTAEEVPAPGVCDGASNNSFVKSKQVSTSVYEDVPGSLGVHAPDTTKPLPTRVKDHWKGSVEVVFLTPPEDEQDTESNVN